MYPTLLLLSRNTYEWQRVLIRRISRLAMAFLVRHGDYAGEGSRLVVLMGLELQLPVWPLRTTSEASREMML